MAQAQFGGLWRSAVKQLPAHLIPAVLIGLVDKVREQQTAHVAAHQADQVDQRQVGLEQQAGLTDAAITHRCQLIQVQITRPGGLELKLGVAQFFVLQFQLDLVDAQLMQRFLQQRRRQVLVVAGRPRRRVCCHRLGAMAQRLAVGRVGRVGRIGRVGCVGCRVSGWRVLAVHVVPLAAVRVRHQDRRRITKPGRGAICAASLFRRLAPFPVTTPVL